ncbi:mpv-z-n3r [Skunkpox virus]|uniref:Mpv-z-n3r n=1 Tax=Skunkpox virus TaxID=160796 RepID=A0A1C9KBG1_9POXV|nr:mpv-z-n3r [Skunkpox virus]AOP31489.1 mpv-z-n3r [Skunkpox virus]
MYLPAFYILISLSFSNCHKLSYYFDLVINGSDTTNTVDVFLDNNHIITFDGNNVYPTIPFMVGDKIFLPFYKDMFTDFFRQFRIVTNDVHEELSYNYACEYTNNVPTFTQYCLYNGEKYTNEDSGSHVTNKNMWLRTSDFRFQKLFDGDDCIIHLRSLVRKMENNKQRNV